MHQTITADVADTRAAGRLDVEPGAPLLVGKRTTRDAEGVAVLYSEHRYPAVRTQFEIDFALNVTNAGVLQHG